MDVDESNLPELRRQLAELPLTSQEVDVLMRHLTDRIIGHFGSETFDVWQAKWGLHRFGAEELAALSLVKLAPLLAALPESTVAKLEQDAELAAPLTFPWDDRY